jgi:hypothetical protein
LAHGDLMQPSADLVAIGPVAAPIAPALARLLPIARIDLYQFHRPALRDTCPLCGNPTRSTPNAIGEPAAAVVHADGSAGDTQAGTMPGEYLTAVELRFPRRWLPWYRARTVAAWASWPNGCRPGGAPRAGDCYGVTTRWVSTWATPGAAAAADAAARSSFREWTFP